MVKTRKASVSAGSLAASPSHLMHRALQRALDIYAEEMGPNAPTQRQYAVLAAAAEAEGLTQADLVRATGIDRSTLADLAARMATKGLLQRERSATDARAKAVRLSDQGRAALEAARPCVEAADRRILELMPKGKRADFLERLAAMAEAADAAPTQARAAAKAEKKAKKAAKKAEKAARKIEPAPAKPAKPAKTRKAKAVAPVSE